MTLNSKCAALGSFSAKQGLGAYADAMEAIYVDDDMHGFLHAEPVFVVSAIGFTASVFASCARLHGLVLNFGNGKTEAILSLRGPSAKAIRQEIEAVGGILTEYMLLSVW